MMKLHAVYTMSSVQASVFVCSMLYHGYHANSTSSDGKADHEVWEDESVISKHTNITKPAVPMRKMRVASNTPAALNGGRRRLPSTNTEALLIAKAKSEETGIPLPVHSIEDPKPYHSGKNSLPQKTLDEYEKHRGLKSKDYAIKCLSVASRFKNKPWLHQVRQAMFIASRGVKKTLKQQGHIFLPQIEMGKTQLEEKKPVPDIETASVITV